MNLPQSNDLPVNILATCFNNTVATYKFYWFLSLLQSVESGQRAIEKRELFSRMLANAWYTVNFFHVSFGKQDRIQDAVLKVRAIEGLTVDERKEVIIKTLITSSNRETGKILWHFDNNVPHWFLSPFFPRQRGISDEEQTKKIYEVSKSFSNQCLYALDEKTIEVNRHWERYLVNNAKFLKDFCYWNLALYLQAKNPNVPDIPNKLIKAAVRNNLLKQRTHFWDLVLSELGSVNCIYTGTRLSIGNYAVEHFIPYNFVSHDLIWNLIPAEKSFNSFKSDRLPQMEKYFDLFYGLQKSAIEIMRIKSPNNKLLEDYLTIFPDLENLSKERFKERIFPLVTIASNNGFEFLP